MISVAGQVVVVTGAGRGLGEAYARLLGARGAHVAVHDAGVDRDGSGGDPAPARTVRDAIINAGGRASAHVQNLATRSGCEDLIGEALAEHGRVDALVHNAGIVRYHGIEDAPVDEYHRTMAINADAAWWLCRAVWPSMRAQTYGRMVLTVSDYALRTSRMLPVKRSSSARATDSALREVVGLEPWVNNVPIRGGGRMSVAETSGRARDYPFSQPDRLQLDPLYARLRAQEPLTRVRLPYGEEAWLATRYADVKLVLGDPRFSRALAQGRDEPRTMPRLPETGLLAMDPPDHTRIRTLVAKAFTARRVEQLRPRTQQIADQLVDAMVDGGKPADFIEAFAGPLPTTVICELLGIPEADREQFSTWAEAIISTTSLSVDQIGDYLQNMRGYMAEQIETRRRRHTGDLLDAMVSARDERQDRLTEQELIDLAFGLLAAGQETTVTQLPNFVYVLLTHPQRWRELCADPGLVPAAVEELMRYIPLGVAAAFPRYAKEDVELGGVLVRVGEPVLAAVHSANRDATAFPDPDQIDFHRDARPHFGFGHGAHHCLGAQLARMELQVGLGTLVRRLPDLRFAVPAEELRWKSGILVRGLASLPVQW